MKNYLVSNVLECADKTFTTVAQKSACENKFNNNIDSKRFDSEELIAQQAAWANIDNTIKVYEKYSSNAFSTY